MQYDLLGNVYSNNNASHYDDNCLYSSSLVIPSHLTSPTLSFHSPLSSCMSFYLSDESLSSLPSSSRDLVLIIELAQPILTIPSIANVLLDPSNTLHLTFLLPSSVANNIVSNNHATTTRDKVGIHKPKAYLANVNT